MQYGIVHASQETQYENKILNSSDTKKTMDNDKIKEYEKTMVLTMPSAVKMCDFVKSMLLGQTIPMSEVTIRLGFEYFKASIKKGIEMSQGLSEADKNMQKSFVDAISLKGEEDITNQLKIEGKLIP